MWSNKITFSIKRLVFAQTHAYAGASLTQPASNQSAATLLPSQSESLPWTDAKSSLAEIKLWIYGQCPCLCRFLS